MQNNITNTISIHQKSKILKFINIKCWQGMEQSELKTLLVALNYDPHLHQVEKTHGTKPHIDQDNVLYLMLDRVHINLLFFTNFCTKHIIFIIKKCLIFCFGSKQNLVVSKISFISRKSKDFEVIIKTPPRFNILVICTFPN